MTAVEHQPDLDTFVAGARAWLVDRLPLRPARRHDLGWGEGSDDVSIFHDLTAGEERRLLDDALAWQRIKFAAGYGAISLPIEYGGAGLPRSYERAFSREEARYQTPATHETFGATLSMMAPAIAAYGTDEQKARLLPRLFGGHDLCCQLFSEPGAGSDLAGLATRARRDGDRWIVDGQKVWSSGALFARYGMLLARTDPSLPKHRGITAFVLPMGSAGVEVRPIRQMSGGSSFNEVFLTGVEVSDDDRLGVEGDGWRIASMILSLERRGEGGGAGRVGGSYREVVALARWLGRSSEPLVRQELARLYAEHRILQLNSQRAAASARAGTPGPEASIAKLAFVQQLTRVGEAAARLLGPRLGADTGEWGTYAWTAHLCGTPAYHIAGGTDEVQRNIIGERVLGLPAEPGPGRDVPFHDIARAGWR